jgi:hypothetical protein
VAIACVWRVNIGLRHLLPAYPFLFLLAGRAWGTAFERSGAASRWAGRLLAGFALACLGWNGIEAARIVPYDLAYFNGFVGGPANGHLYLLDSNLDWGQASRTLARWEDAEGLPALYCSFTGSADPAYYGVRYQYVPGIGNFADSAGRARALPEDLPREILAVSATALHFVLSRGEPLYELLKSRPVVARPGYAFVAYDITRDAEVHARLAEIYAGRGLPALAERERLRVRRLTGRAE